MAIFNPYSKFWMIFDTVMDYVRLGLMVVLFSLPLFTMGTAIAAGMTVAMRIERGEAPTVVRPFWKAFKENFKQGLPLTLVFGGIFTLLAADWYTVTQMEATASVRFLELGIVVLAVLVVMIGFYVFAGMARYELRWKALVRNAVIYTFLNFPKNLLGVGILVAGLLLYNYAQPIVPVIICAVPALEMFYMGKVCMTTFRKLEGKQTDEEDPEE